ncbi:MAG: hypothetical protein KIG14_01450, partial [Candidatus Sacchiramonaceae bacterium]|nr:hypothetical protein [Candidatus Saccharimonadaceae bacterium]
KLTNKHIDTEKTHIPSEWDYEPEENQEKSPEENRERIHQLNLAIGKAALFALEFDKKESTLYTPALRTEDGKYFGRAKWDVREIGLDKAEEMAIKTSQEFSRHSNKNLVNVSVGDKEVRFSSLDDFDPIVPFGEKAPDNWQRKNDYWLDTNLRKNQNMPLLKRLKTRHVAENDEVTEKIPDWSRQLRDRVEDYVLDLDFDKLEDLGLIEKGKNSIGNNDLRYLSPKQAVMIATEMVIDNTKYAYNDIRGNDTTKNDTKSVIELLDDFRDNHNNPNWDGNGVCRNFAKMTNLIFQSIKDMQDPKYSRLNTTFCYDQEGLGEKFDPGSEGAHAWNIFTTVLDGDKSESVVIDTTWGKRDLKTKEIIDADQTQDRAEHMLFKFALKTNNHLQYENSPPDTTDLANGVKKFYIDIINRRKDSAESISLYASNLSYLNTSFEDASFNDLPLATRNQILAPYVSKQSKIGNEEILQYLISLKPDDSRHADRLFNDFVKDRDLSPAAYEGLKKRFGMSGRVS